MKRLSFLFLLLPFFTFAQNGFVISGNVAGLPDGAEVTITSTQDNNVIVAKSTVKSGAFTINGTVLEPSLYFITLGAEQPQHIYLENAPIKISGTKKDIKNIKIE